MMPAIVTLPLLPLLLHIIIAMPFFRHADIGIIYA
jgi:hypothetical protein